MENKELIRAIKFTLFSISAGAIELILFELLNGFTNLNYWACYLPALIASIVWKRTVSFSQTLGLLMILRAINSEQNKTSSFFILHLL